MKNKKICVVGLGYIGLPTAILLSMNGYNVVGVDINENLVNNINKGIVHISEPDLNIYLKESISNNKFRATTSTSFADIFIISVPTPINNDNTPNINYVISAIKSITPYIIDGSIIILESTIPVGTTKKIEYLLKELGINTNKLYIAYCPERVLPGNIIKELINNDRIIGGTTKKATDIVTFFYKTFIKGNIYKTDSKTAEMVKLSENAFRDVNIAFANELSIICDKFDIKVSDVISLANKHPRVDILNPGIGVGGHCIAVDPWFIINSDKENSKLIKTSREVNKYKTKWIFKKIKNIIFDFEKTHNKKPSIACLGLSYKPNVGDLRESPAVEIVCKLINMKKYNIKAVEPHIKDHQFIDLTTIEEALKCDLIFLLVLHDEFKQINQNNKIIKFQE